MPRVADAELIDAFVGRRDEPSFDALYERYADRHYRLVLRLAAGDRDLADDLFQDAWVVALSRLERFEGRSTFYTWLVGISINLVRAFWRTRPRGEALEDVEDPKAEPRPDALVDAARILEQLPPGYRAVLVLHSEGYTHEEIGEILSISDGTSKSQLARGREAARRLMKGTRT